MSASPWASAEAGAPKAPPGRDLATDPQGRAATSIPERQGTVGRVTAEEESGCFGGDPGCGRPSTSTLPRELHRGGARSLDQHSFASRVRQATAAAVRCGRGPSQRLVRRRGEGVAFNQIRPRLERIPRRSSGSAHIRGFWSPRSNAVVSDQPQRVRGQGASEPTHGHLAGERATRSRVTCWCACRDLLPDRGCPARSKPWRWAWQAASLRPCARSGPREPPGARRSR